jgi:hypothetical protein
MMHRTRTILFLLIITLAAQPVFGSDKTINIAADKITQVSIIDIHPTQPEAGLASTELLRKSKYSKISDMEEYRTKVLAENPLKTVRGPGGEIYLTDGHHRALGVFRTASEKCEKTKSVEPVDACMKKIEVRVKVEADFSQGSWDDFLDALQKSNNIYLPPEVRAKLQRGEITKQQIFKYPGGVLPPNIGMLADNPLRSSLGSLFSRSKFNIDASNFVNYLEYLLGEKIADKVKVESGREFDPEVQIDLTRAIFYTPEILKYMRCLAKTDDFSWEKAQTDINLALRLDGNLPFEQSSCEASR